MAETAPTKIFDMPPQGAGFALRGAWLIRRLMFDLDVTQIQAAAVAGNLGGESGLKAINEEAPIVPGSAGGFGWAQWTGRPGRRQDFEEWCREASLSPTQDEANYGFLLEELRGDQAHSLEQLKKTDTVPAGVFTFEYFYERPANLYGDLPRREALANEALEAFNAPAQIPPLPSKQFETKVVSVGAEVKFMPPAVQTSTTPQTIMLPQPVVPVSTGSSTLVSMASGGLAGFLSYTVYLLTQAHPLPDAWYLGLYGCLQGLGAWFGHSQVIAAARAKVLKDLS